MESPSCFVVVCLGVPGWSSRKETCLRWKLQPDPRRNLQNDWGSLDQCHVWKILAPTYSWEETKQVLFDLTTHQRSWTYPGAESHILPTITMRRSYLLLQWEGPCGPTCQGVCMSHTDIWSCVHTHEIQLHSPTNTLFWTRRVTDQWTTV